MFCMLLCCISVSLQPGFRIARLPRTGRGAGDLVSNFKLLQSLCDGRDTPFNCMVQHSCCKRRLSPLLLHTAVLSLFS